MSEHAGSAIGAPDPERAESDFRRAVGRFATGVCAVTSLLDGRDHAMTANAFASVSLEPLLVVVSVAEDTRFLEAVLGSGVWGVSVLPASARGVADWLASSGRPLVGQLDRVAHHRGPRTGVALVDGALATLECRTSDVHPAGDHHLVVGEVVGIELADVPADPLLYHQGRYRVLGER